MGNIDLTIVDTVRVVIFNQNNELLFLKKDILSKNPKKYELPGGKVEDQSLEIAAKKEVLEETGLIIENLKIVSEISPFEYSFEIDGIRNFRRVYFFTTELQVDKSNFDKNFSELSKLTRAEDKHCDHLWIEASDLNLLKSDISANSIEFVNFYLQSDKG